MKKKIKVVVIGGGNGGALAVGALKRHSEKYDLSAVVSVSDSGGSSGRLRREFKMLPAGDILRVVLASGRYDYDVLRRLFYQVRFLNCGKLSGHNLGNLFLTLGAHYSGNFIEVIEALSQSVGALAKVYPVTLTPHDLVAELDNGKIICTEEKIDVPEYNRAWKIKKVWLKPKVRAYAPALKAIEGADYVVLSPGSLYTSVIPALLPLGVKTALKKSHARFIYVGSAYRTRGETGPENYSGFLKQLENYLPRPLELALYDKFKFDAPRRKYYAQERWACPLFDKNNLADRRVLAVDYERAQGGISTVKLGKILQKIIK